MAKYTIEFKKEDNRIKRDISALKEVQHSLLIRYVDDFAFKGETNQIHQVVIMEYFESVNLNVFLNNLKDYDEDLLTTIFKDILLGVLELHKCKIIHRDLKPVNILINSKNNMLVR